jgi:hypothetical protein
LLARDPLVGVDVDDRRVGAVSPKVPGVPKVGAVRDVDVAWYRRLHNLKLGGVVRVDEGNIYKDPTDLRLDVSGPYVGDDQLTFDGTVHLDGFDAVRGVMTMRLRFHDPGKLWQEAKAITPDDLFKRLVPVLHQALPSLDATKLANELTAALSQLIAGEVTPEAFVKSVGQIAKRATKGANAAALEKALWGFLAEVGPELEASGQVEGLGALGTRLHGRARFTPSGPEVTYGAKRLILAPPGAVTSTVAPAYGSFEETQTLKIHKRFMYGVLQKLDTDALGRSGALFVEKFPTSGYLEYTHATRLGDDAEVGIRLGVRVSSSDVAKYIPHPQPALSAADQRRNLIGSYQDTFEPRRRGDDPAPLAELVPPLPTEIPYNVGVTIYAHWK